MVKRNFLVFVLLSLVIVLVGVIFLFLDKEIFIPAFTNDTGENIIVNGWPIVVIGLVMLLFGLLIKWSVRNDRSKNDAMGDPSTTELID